jgi:hypothetical protein
MCIRCSEALVSVFVQEVCPDEPVDEDSLQELLFDRLGIVLLPPGAGNVPLSKHNKGPAHKEPTLEEFINKTRQLLQIEEQEEVEQADAELCNFSAAGAQVCSIV